MAVDRGALQFDLFGEHVASGPADSVDSAPMMAADRWQMPETSVFLDALKRGALSDSIAAIRRLNVDAAWKVLLEAGFAVTASKTHGELLAFLQDDLMEAAQRRMSGRELQAARCEGAPNRLVATQSPSVHQIPLACQAAITFDGDDVLARLQRETVRFASGMSSISDLENGTYARAGHQTRGIGVDVGLLSANGIQQLGKAIINWRTPVFIDSGAFSDFRKAIKAGEEVKPLDFAGVMDRYNRILDAIADENTIEDNDYPRPLMVMPDVVGDQAASLALLKEHREAISAHLTFNISQPIVPLQRGALSLHEAYQQAKETLGSAEFIVGLPSNAKAISRGELADFLKSAKPGRVHFLGAAAPSTLNPLMAIVAQHSPETLVSADASQVRNTILSGVENGLTRADAIFKALHDCNDPLIAPYYSAGQIDVPLKSFVDAANNGRYIGQVVTVADGKVIQDAGRGTLVGHDLSNFPEAPNVGDDLDIRYTNKVIKTAAARPQDGRSMNTR